MPSTRGSGPGSPLLGDPGPFQAAAAQSGTIGPPESFVDGWEVREALQAARAELEVAHERLAAAHVELERRDGSAVVVLETVKVRVGLGDADAGTRLQHVGRLGAVLVGLTGLVVLVGWYAGLSALTTVLPGYPPMRPNTAVGFILLGIALGLLERRRLAVPLAGAAAAVGGATLVEYALSRSLGIDALLPGIDLGDVAPRMASASALSLLLLGVAAVVGRLGRAMFMRALAVVAVGVGQVAILGYAYGVSSLYTVGGATSMALHTAVCVVVLSLSILLHDPSAGLVGLLRDQGSAGKLLRPIAPFLLLGPSLLGGLRLWAQAQAGSTLVSGSVCW